jgi:hypothetical protein
VNAAGVDALGAAIALGPVAVDAVLTPGGEAAGDVIGAVSPGAAPADLGVVGEQVGDTAFADTGLLTPGVDAADAGVLSPVQEVEEFGGLGPGADTVVADTGLITPPVVPAVPAGVVTTAVGAAEKVGAGVVTSEIAKLLAPSAPPSTARPPASAALTPAKPAQLADLAPLALVALAVLKFL